MSFFVWGCSGGSGGNIPRTAPVSGVVLLDGKPVDGAQVVFVPTGSPGYGAYATTDSQGRFQLKSSEDVSGAVPGKYLVQVTKLVTRRGGSSFLVKEDAEHALQAAGGSRAPEEGETVNVLPEKYASSKTSGIEVTVPKEGLTDLKIELSSQQ
jgi:hypothetical protein